MQAIGFIGYQLIYIQLPLLIAPLPTSDLLRFSWSTEEAKIGLYPYRDSLIGQFRSHEYYTRSILGENDLFLLSGGTVMRDTPYSFIRMVSGDYRFLNFYFQRRTDWGDISGGISGLHTYRGALKGYVNLTIPLKLERLEGTVALSAYSDIWSGSFNSNYFFIGTTKDKWLGYLKIGDLRLGSTYDKQFISYLFRPIDPVFLVLSEIVSDGSIDKEEWEVTDWFIAPIYVFTLERSIYGVISKSPVVGLKTEFFDIEVGKESYLSVKTEFLRAFITYSKEDSLPYGGIGGKLSYPFYDNKVAPGVEGSFHDGDLDLGLTLRILETEIFWGKKNIPYGDFFWGLNADFSF
jgi:hypothetical protein